MYQKRRCIENKINCYKHPVKQSHLHALQRRHYYLPWKTLQSIWKRDKELADTLKATGGLGTVATRADIIDKLFNSFLIEKRGVKIFTLRKKGVNCWI